MAFLTLDKFLSHFSLNDDHNCNLSKDQFEKELIITYTQPMSLYNINRFIPRIRNLKPILEQCENDPRFLKRSQIIDTLYDILITNKTKYITRFYNSYFPIINDPFKLEWNNVDLNISSKYNNNHHTTPQLSTSVNANENTEIYISVQLNDTSRKIIRNIFYLELLDKTRIINTVKSHESFWFALTSTFNNLKLQDRFFAKSSLDLIMRKNNKGEYTQTFFYLFQSYLPKASILNPYSIKWIIDNRLTPLLPSYIRHSSNKTIFTPVMSWCSYQIAFFHLNDSWRNYIGVDVMPTVCHKSTLLTEHYYSLQPTLRNTKRIKLFCIPSERLYENGHGQFPIAFRKRVDLVICCFPYFNMEEYGEGEQSTKNFPNYTDWLVNYITPTIKLCATVLKRGGIFAYITNNYSTIDKSKTYYDLKDDFKQICQNCKDVNGNPELKYREEYMLLNRTSPLRTVKKDRIEIMYVFSKN
jgi:hypothetical protein